MFRPFFACYWEGAQMRRRQSAGGYIACMLVLMDNLIRKALRVALFITSVSIATLMCAVVLLRYGFQTDLYGIEELVKLVGVWLFFLGASYASQSEEQITAGVIPEYLRSPVCRKALDVVTRTVSFGVCAIATVWAWDWLIWGIKFPQKTPVYEISLAVTHVAVFVSFLLMTIFTLRDALRLAVSLFKMLFRRNETDLS